MNALDQLATFLEAAQRKVAASQEELSYQTLQVDIWRKEAKNWQKRAQDAEVELNNIRAWARTPTKAEAMGINPLEFPRTDADLRYAAAGQMVANAAATDRAARLERNESGMP